LSPTAVDHQLDMINKLLIRPSRLKSASV
jgi:hypothetical protein